MGFIFKTDHYSLLVPVVSFSQTAGEGDEPLDWLYQTPADGAGETEQISQVCSSAGVRDLYSPGGNAALEFNW